jgi:D-amino peptidase
MRLAHVAVLTLACAAAAAGTDARDGRKVFVSADMEGIAGVVTNEQLGPPGFEYPRFRELMTEEVNAALAAAREAGATEFVVADSHGNGLNLLVDKLPKDVTVVRSFPRPLGMMQGIDESFDAVVFVGYHAGTTNPEGVRAHTLSSATLADVRINGVSFLEAGLNAALAGHYGVPVLAISGDDAAVREATALLGGVEGAVVKWALGFHSARTLTPEAARDVIREAVRKGMARRSEIKPFRVATPVELEVRFKNYRPAEVLGFLPGVRRADAHAVRLTARDMPEAARILSFITQYQPTLEP